MVELHCTLTPITESHTAHTALCHCIVSLTPQATTGHNWHVHQRRRQADGVCSPETVGDHYDPFLVKAEMNAGYDEECGPNAQLRCEMGDLAKKHGRMRIEGGGVSPRMTSVGYDVNLHLAGPYTGELTDVCIISLPSLGFPWLTTLKFGV